MGYVLFLLILTIKVGFICEYVVSKPWTFITVHIWVTKELKIYGTFEYTR